MKIFNRFKNINISKAPPIFLSVICVGAIMDTYKDFAEGKTTRSENIFAVVITVIILGLTIYLWLKKNGNFK